MTLVTNGVIHFFCPPRAMSIDIERDVRARLVSVGATTEWLDRLVAVHQAQEAPPPNICDRVMGASGQYTHWRKPPGPTGKVSTRSLVSVTTLMKNHLTVHFRKGRQKGGNGKGRRPAKSLQPAMVFKLKKTKSTPNAAPSRIYVSGAQLGSFVHKQMEDIVYMAPAGFLRKYPAGPHKSTVALCRAIHSQGLVPVVPEFLVYDLDRGRATRIDMVAVEIATGCLVFIEYKTGYGDGVFMQPQVRAASFVDRCAITPPQANQRWRAPLLRAQQETFPCSPYNMACIQLVLGTEMAVQMLQLPPTAFALRARVPCYSYVAQVMHADLDRRTQRFKHVHTVNITHASYTLLGQILATATMGPA